MDISVFTAYNGLHSTVDQSVTNKAWTFRSIIINK